MYHNGLLILWDILSDTWDKWLGVRGIHQLLHVTTPALLMV